MSAEKVRQSMENLGRALDRLNEVLQEERTEFMADPHLPVFGKTLFRSTPIGERW